MIFRVLVVENNQLQAEKTGLTLKRSFMPFKDKVGIEAVHIEKAHSVSEARRLLEQTPADGRLYDLMLLDLGLPENQDEDDDPQGGLKILELASATNAIRYTIVISVFAEYDQYATQAFDLGAFDVIGKPYENERLLDSIFACLPDILALHRPESDTVRQLRQRIKGESPELLKTIREVAKVIPHAHAGVLLIGETGTGKELFARAIHELGPDRQEPWEPVNINAYPPELVESHIFGHEKGAFTNANVQRIGHLERAGGGTLFLDEIGELPEQTQVKLLRVIQEREFYRLGGTDKLPFKARLVCATNRDLKAAMNNGVFRGDFFHRVAGITIEIPPLRSRKGDIDVLLNHFLTEFRNQYGRSRQIEFAPETVARLRKHPFPGNVRELQNLIQSAVISCEGDKILTRHIWSSLQRSLRKDSPSEPAPDWQENKKGTLIEELIRELKEILPTNWWERPYHEVEDKYLQAFYRVYLQNLLRRYTYNVTKAARAVNMDPKTLRSKWEQADLGPLRNGNGDD
jgi:DNA-binding NtrC family response regulator